jgi:micrococcal nuclease
MLVPWQPGPGRVAGLIEAIRRAFQWIGVLAVIAVLGFAWHLARRNETASASHSAVVKSAVFPSGARSYTRTPPTTPRLADRSHAAAANPEASLRVSRVIDGDTLVLADGRHVRLAQVDAPETNACFGSQSTAALRRLADGQSVTLRRPSTAPKTDRYGRTLADIYVGDTSINEALVREGAAGFYAQFGPEDPELARRLVAAEEEAREAGRGLWSACRSGSR